MTIRHTLNSLKPHKGARRCLKLVFSALRVLPLGTGLVAATPASAQAGQGMGRLPRVLVLATGGTIAGKADPRSAIGYDAGSTTGQQLVAAVPGVDRLAQLQVEQIANIPSQDMNHKVWFRLMERINQAFARHEADAVVITHGTDTMEETAFFLDTVLHHDQPVVMTGAMRPGSAISADGPANIYEAVKVAAHPQAKGRGVLVVLNDTIHAAHWVSKADSTVLQTFVSRQTGPVGIVDPAAVRFYGPPRPRLFLSLPDGATLPAVDVVYAHADMDGRQIDDAIRAGVKGIVIAGMGDGNVSAQAMQALDRAVRAGIVVVRSSRVGDGFVNRDVEVDDEAHHFVASYDLNPQKARLLLQLLLAGGVQDVQAVQRAFAFGY
ncbi:MULTISPECIES: asparaginase [Acetobacteraceae]|uniref:L-asparaginase n=3 Tax=Acetobacteraceae TaxID=433 RepID=A0A7U7G706_9PROT|nr:MULTISPECIES: asparaginase [Acetobacteraceae]MCQ0041655.1 asparaginase [Bombella sp.]CDG34283.1 L-asparaginase [Parasaccharibacter apium]